MDLIDKKILERLNVDGRITMKNLATELNLSAPAVAERVKRLEQKGIITAYKAIIDREKLGQGITVFITIDMPASKYEEFKVFANGASEISE
ncbi:Lrp/AsnC family transcriptional regulator, partial [Anaerofustis stercorihominis]